MALWKFTTKRSGTINGIRIEKGMTIEVVTPNTSNPLNTPQGKEQIAVAFMHKYGVDLKKAHYLTSANLDCSMNK